jgi:inositol-1,3,4-trisphosphate 5/6-kinase/inositol-tetrakisphosphate 1-kinase
MAEEFCTPRHLVTMKDPSSIPIAVAMAGLTLPLGNLFDPVNIIILDR